MKKRLICSVLAALLAGSALANQPGAGKAAAVDPLSGAVPDAESAAQNPLTGRNLSVERLEKELEVQKKATALLEERLRQHGIRIDAQNLATKKDAEMSSFRTQLVRERAERATLGPAQAPAEAATKPSTQKKPKPVAKPAPQPAAEVIITEPAAPRYEVVGVSGGAAGISVILSTASGTAAYGHGDMSPWGKVSIDPEQGRVRIGSQTQSLPENAIARRQFSDPRSSMKPGGVPAVTIPPGGTAAGRSNGIGIPVPPRPNEGAR